MAEVKCPYVGLAPYTQDDARFFFGRERETRLIVANLFASRLTLLYGASGVGKTSVLRAGAMKELEGRRERAVTAGEPPEEVAVYFKDWQGDPLLWLREAVRRAAAAAHPASELPTTATEESLAPWLASLGDQLECDLLIVLDQFEEYFLYHEGESETPGSFAHQLAEAITRPGLPVSFLISLRDDALAQLDRFKLLIPDLFANYLRLEPLSEDQARAAITKPIVAYNQLPAALRHYSGVIEIEPGLVDAVVVQMRQGQGQQQILATAAGVETPYLQLVMTRIWEEELGAGSHTLRLQTLARLGDAEEIIKEHFKRAMRRLTPEERGLCARIFHHLVTPGGTKIALSAKDLADYAEVALEETERLLGKVAGSDMRLLVPVVAPDAAGVVRYEIRHDSLGAAILDWRRRQEEKRQQAELLQQARLDQERRAARRMRRLVGMLVLVAVLALAAALTALIQTKKARKSEEEAANLGREIATKAEEFSRILAAKEEAEARQKELEADHLVLEGKADEAELLHHEVEMIRKELALRIRTLEDLRKTLGTSGETENSALQRRLARALTRAREAERQLAVLRLEPPKSQPGEELQDQGIAFVRIYPGTFTMGSAAAEAYDFEKPAHEVTLSEFWIGKYEVSNEEYRLQHSDHKGEGKLPATHVSWNEAREFCEHFGFELPTEAQWEYAARAGTRTPWSFGADEKELGRYAWYRENSDREAHPVGEKEPNPWSLYDMHGNVWEWVYDEYAPFIEDPQTDPKGPETAKTSAVRVLRGGAYWNGSRRVRSAYRFRIRPEHRNVRVGFRCVRRPSLQP